MLGDAFQTGPSSFFLGKSAIVEQHMLPEVVAGANLRRTCIPGTMAAPTADEPMQCPLEGAASVSGRDLAPYAPLPRPHH
jgi:hypothetical protein